MAGGLPPPRRAALRRLVDPRDEELIDQGLVLWFPSPASFTGDDMAELHLHGGRSVVKAAIDTLLSLGCRLAEPGEFARRAFANGKLDLAAVEGLADLIDAETELQRRQALRQLGGVLGRRAEQWARSLMEAMAWAEAALDFSDEADVPAQSLVTVIPALRRVATEIGDVLAAEGRQGERLREGFVVAITGPPNAGKSSLLNALARRDAAIVSPVPGTTRDAIEVALDLEGLPLLLIDTAGIRDSSDPVEIEGVARARRKAAEADLVLWLEARDSTPDEASAPPSRAIRVLSKSDLPAPSDSAAERRKGFVNLSVRTEEGLKPLLALLARKAEESLGGGEALVTRARHRASLEDCRSHLLAAIRDFETGAGEEMVAEGLRLAQRALGRVTGRVDVEDVLGAIFSQFCIGK